MNNLFNLIVTIGCVIVVVSSQRVRTEKHCRKYDSCIKLSDCPSMLKLVKTRTKENIGKVQKAHCGFQGPIPKVCCSNTTHLPSKCGETFASDRIYGGRISPIGGHPWIVAIGYSEPDESTVEFLCAGSIINENYILTAAHCLDPQDIGTKVITVIRLGEWDLTNSPDCEHTRLGEECAPLHIETTVKFTYTHPDYNLRAPYSDDIAIIRLNTTLNFDTPYITPICLPPQDIDPRSIVGNRELVVAGWGFTNTSNTISDLLMQVSLPFKPHSQCKSYTEYLDKQLCVGGTKGKDSCTGDSGSPLIIAGPAGPPFLQLGIVSFGPTNCGIEDFPAVYTSVSPYISWIEEIIK